MPSKKFQNTHGIVEIDIKSLKGSKRQRLHAHGEIVTPVNVKQPRDYLKDSILFRISAVLVTVQSQGGHSDTVRQLTEMQEAAAKSAFDDTMAIRLGTLERRHGIVYTY